MSKGKRVHKPQRHAPKGDRKKIKLGEEGRIARDLRAARITREDTQRRRENNAAQ